MKLWCHWHVSTSTSPHSFLLTPGSGCDKKMQHILFLTFHLSTQVCRTFQCHPHHLFFYLGLCDVHFRPLSCPPPDPFLTFREELSPFSCGKQQSPWGGAIKDSPLCISHSLQGNHQNLGGYREASSHELNHQPGCGWIIYLWLTRAGSHIATTLVFPNDTGF